MPTLDWIGKSAVINHHNEVPFRLLKRNNDLSVGDPGSGNLLVQGDNLEALKALLPYYAGQVKCIYIDPPYNTGNESWVYNDNVNSSEMKGWLGKVVGKEAEDLSRHDKWLCMMYPRLSLLKQFLSEDGAIFVSIDDNELANLRLVMDDIFGNRNFITSLTWQKRVSPANDAKYFSSDHEHLLVFCKNKNIWRPNRLKRSQAQLKNYVNPDNDPRGIWNSATYTCNKTFEERPNLYYGIVNPFTGKTIYPKKTAVWKFNKERHEENVKNNLVYWGDKGKNKMPRYKKFLSEMEGIVPRSVLLYSDYGHTQEARSELLQIIKEVPFTTPKPVRLIKRLLEIATDNNSIILDSYAGSGTTGHAVTQLNKEDGGTRNYILVEIDEPICKEITSQRLSNIVKGYECENSKGITIFVNGLGGGFSYCDLGHTLFDAEGQIRSEVSFCDLARHVYFSETGEPIPKSQNGKTPLLGVYQGRAIYLLYNGILKDKSVGGGNVLTSRVLSELPPFEGPKVIYGTACRISPKRLKQENIVFKQTPYEIRIK